MPGERNDLLHESYFLVAHLFAAPCVRQDGVRRELGIIEILELERCCIE
jgi:hypothetical protein